MLFLLQIQTGHTFRPLHVSYFQSHHVLHVSETSGFQDCVGNYFFVAGQRHGVIGAVRSRSVCFAYWQEITARTMRYASQALNYWCCCVDVGRLGKIICCWSRRWRRLNWSVRLPGLKCPRCSANFMLLSSRSRSVPRRSFTCLFIATLSLSFQLTLTLIFVYSNARTLVAFALICLIYLFVNKKHETFCAR